MDPLVDGWVKFLEHPADSTRERFVGAGIHGLFRGGELVLVENLVCAVTALLHGDNRYLPIFHVQGQFYVF